MKTRKLHQPILKRKTDAAWLCGKLCDHQLHLLGQSLSAEMRMSLKTTLFRDLILSGSDTCIGLINSLIHRYLDDAASTDAISEKTSVPLSLPK